MKKLIFYFLLSFLCACHNVPVWKYSMFEKPYGNGQYDPLYTKGWQDGCESGAQASSNHLYRIRYKFKQDWQLITNTIYRNGWDNAYNQCRKYILQQNLNTEHAQIDEGINIWTWQ